MKVNDSCADFVETIYANDQKLALIIRRGFSPPQTTFLTPPEAHQQLGFIVYPARGKIARHEHLSLERNITGTSEVILVYLGSCEVDIYNKARELVAVRRLQQGDIIYFIDCGHGFRMLEDTILLEIKQGPYLCAKDKDLF